MFLVCIFLTSNKYEFSIVEPTAFFAIDSRFAVFIWGRRGGATSGHANHYEVILESKKNFLI